jgi:hypothetical protein
MDQIILPTAAGFLGWESAVHRLCKAIYERRPPRPFRLYITNRPGYRAMWPHYPTCDLFTLPHSEWQEPIHNFAKRLEKAIWNRRFHLLRQTNVIDNILATEMTMLCNGIHRDCYGVIRKYTARNWEANILHVTYKMTFDEDVPPTLSDWDDHITVGANIIKFECHVQDTDNVYELEFDFWSYECFTFHGSEGDAAGPLYIQ